MVTKAPAAARRVIKVAALLAAPILIGYLAFGDSRVEKVLRADSAARSCAECWRRGVAAWSQDGRTPRPLRPIGASADLAPYLSDCDCQGRVAVTFQQRPLESLLEFEHPAGRRRFRLEVTLAPEPGGRPAGTSRLLVAEKSDPPDTWSECR